MLVQYTGSMPVVEVANGTGIIIARRNVPFVCPDALAASLIFGEPSQWQQAAAGAVLQYAPPPQSQPTTVVVPSSGGTYGPYGATTDVILDVHTNAPITGTVRGSGGRHVRMIGGVFEPTSGIGNYVVVWQGLAGSFFAEGLEFPDQSAAQPDVIDVCGEYFAGGSTGYAPDIYLQNIRCLNIKANDGTNHADFFQPQGVIGNLYVDKCTITSNYQAFTIAGSTANTSGAVVAPKGIFVNRVNMWYPATNSVNPDTAFFWLNNVDSQPFPIVFGDDDVFIDLVRGVGRSSYGNNVSFALFPCNGVTAAGSAWFAAGEAISFVDFPDHSYAYNPDPKMLFLGKVRNGSPSTSRSDVVTDADSLGSFVAAGIGTNYVSPGYA